MDSEGSVGTGGGHIGKLVGVGGESSGGARGSCGGKGVELNENMVERFGDLRQKEGMEESVRTHRRKRKE